MVYLYLVMSAFLLLCIVLVLWGKFAFAFLAMIPALTILGVVSERLLSKDDTPDLIKNLRSSGKGHCFGVDISSLENQYKSVQTKIEFFSVYAEDNSIRQAFDLIKNKIYHNIESATKYMKCYDYVSLPSTHYLDKLVMEGEHLVKKLSELSDAVLSLDDDIGDVDTGFADDILKSLQRLLEEDNL